MVMLGDAGNVRVYQFGQVGCRVVIYICVYLSVQRDRSRCLERGRDSFRSPGIILLVRCIYVREWVLLYVCEEFQVWRQMMGGRWRRRGANKGWGDQGVDSVLGRRHMEVS